MKKYYREIDGNKEWLGAVLIHNGMQIYNPTEEMILAAGYVEDTTEQSTLSEDEIVERIKNGIKAQIMAYDSSADVNQFYVYDNPIWLDKATRAGLLLRFQAEQVTGIKDTALWYNGMQFPLKVADAISMLFAIELYASACYDNTQKHLSAVSKLETLEDVQRYDYTTGYPEKLRF